MISTLSQNSERNFLFGQKSQFQIQKPYQTSMKLQIPIKSDTKQDLLTFKNFGILYIIIKMRQFFNIENQLSGEPFIFQKFIKQRLSRTDFSFKIIQLILSIYFIGVFIYLEKKDTRSYVFLSISILDLLIVIFNRPKQLFRNIGVAFQNLQLLYANYNLFNDVNQHESKIFINIMMLSISIIMFNQNIAVFTYIILINSLQSIYIYFLVITQYSLIFIILQTLQFFIVNYLFYVERKHEITLFLEKRLFNQNEDQLFQLVDHKISTGVIIVQKTNIEDQKKQENEKFDQQKNLKISFVNQVAIQQLQLDVKQNIFETLKKISINTQENNSQINLQYNLYEQIDFFFHHCIFNTEIQNKEEKQNIISEIQDYQSQNKIKKTAQSDCEQSIIFTGIQRQYTNQRKSQTQLCIDMMFQDIQFDFRFNSIQWDNSPALIIIISNTKEKIINKKLHELEQYKVELFNTISHISKTPLNSIINIADYMLNVILDEHNYYVKKRLYCQQHKKKLNISKKQYKTWLSLKITDLFFYIQQTIFLIYLQFLLKKKYIQIMSFLTQKMPLNKYKKSTFNKYKKKSSNFLFYIKVIQKQQQMTKKESNKFSLNFQETPLNSLLLEKQRLLQKMNHPILYGSKQKTQEKE
ncbi:hypothetical protein IMG5_101220 [Ichthyophthirius multifiliis]|uniref:Transmembrane protein n=1 Tax=Ichthyophthirius multifiliis TaxID=5932 RepID=G0QSI0_ICHMU|nr:hypothetical protein IMG5_101220 [Ichthyophthirius multifiliis]EGR31818.1 hypothetical protein IMG5_101220 [Ichthyophthirius multifiliis]|eukprot:XP_004035304.1 hypothetical protein IMG5_101220 [Ichthyophthirius multifiliis]